MVVLPAPLISQSVSGFPVRLFSHTIGFDPHACARGSGPMLRATPIAPSNKRIRTKSWSARGGCPLDGIWFMVAALFSTDGGHWHDDVRRAREHRPGRDRGQTFSSVCLHESKKNSIRAARTTTTMA